MNPPESQEILDLADRHCAGMLSSDQTRRLNDLLRDDAEAQRLFLSVAEIHARLQWEFGAITATDLPVTASTGTSTPPRRARRLVRWRWSGAAVAVLALVTLVGFVRWFRSDSQSIANHPVASLKRVDGAHWAPGFEPTGAELFPGRIRLDHGLAEIEFACGALAILKAPADVELEDAKRIFLHEGQIIVRVPHDDRAAGFRVDTRTSQLIDLGTEFGVEVESDGDSILQVYEGEVLATAKVVNGENSPRSVFEGQAVRLDATMQEMPFWPERFVRLLPSPEDPQGRGKLPYNRSRLDTVTIVPAKPGVLIDGDLSDWDLSGRFRTECEPPYNENYYLEAAMMYDDRNLYIGAHVGDPYPMRSQIAPQESVNRHGMGGAVALRISTDRKAGWPLRAEAAGPRKGRPAGEQDLSDKLSFIVLWYYQPEQRACIHLRHGMDLHGVKVNPPGYEGAFRQDTDGRGYTLEYAIPWRLLNAEDDPPQGGDELAVMWLTHWSDANGRKWRGQLTDVMQPHEPGWNFARAATWGKAVYYKKRD